MEKVHYAPCGEWGQTRVNCNRYYTTDVAHTWDRMEVTCKHCLKNLKLPKKITKKWIKINAEKF